MTYISLRHFEHIGTNLLNGNSLAGISLNSMPFIKHFYEDVDKCKEVAGREYYFRVFP